MGIQDVSVTLPSLNCKWASIFFLLSNSFVLSLSLRSSQKKTLSLAWQDEAQSHLNAGWGELGRSDVCMFYFTEKIPEFQIYDQESGESLIGASCIVACNCSICEWACIDRGRWKRLDIGV